MPAPRSIQSPAPVRLHMEIDRSSPVPLYFQLTQQIEAAIAGGSVVAGARLPNEVALADELGLCRETIRQAYGQLMDRGLLARKRGVGTVVMNGYVNLSLGLTSLYDPRRADQSPSTTVISRRMGPAAVDVADALQGYFEMTARCPGSRCRWPDRPATVAPDAPVARHRSL